MAMANVNLGTIMMAVQAIKRERIRLQKEIEANPEDPDTPDLQELELSYWKAQMELKDAYISNRPPDSNLPEYSTFDDE
jgi:hypothetical protein